MEMFLASVKNWTENISASSVIMMIMMIFMLIGAVDKILGNKFGYGEKFEEGFQAIGPLTLSMAGVIAAAPVLSKMLEPVIAPIYQFFGADPSMFATTLLASDMGGYSMAMELASDEAIGNFSGLILGTMMGVTLVFTIPVALGLIKKEDRSYLGAGVLAGLITVPFGCVAGGIAMGLFTDYKLSLHTILINLIPVMIIALLIIVGLWVAPKKMISGFNIFGIGITIMITVFTAIAIFQQITGIMIPGLDVMSLPNETTGLTPLDEGLLTCGQIGIVLVGAFPMVKWITKTFGGALKKLGKLMGINEQASAGMVATMANNIAMFNIMKDMDPKGKLINVAFAVAASFVFGDHLGFTAGVNQSMITPVIIGKLVAGVLAVGTANLLAPKLLQKVNGEETEKVAALNQKAKLKTHHA